MTRADERVGQMEGPSALPRKNGSYRLTFETVKPASRLAKFGVRLVAVGGGFK